MNYEKLNPDDLCDSVEITVRYDKFLENITNVREESVRISPGAPFIFILSSILTEHPGIQTTLPPGMLGFTVNGKPPCEDTRLEKGDIIELLVPEECWKN